LTKIERRTLTFCL